MSSLHILNKAHPHPAFQQCLHSLRPTDTLLLIEDGVYALNKLSSLDNFAGKLYVLDEDAQVRGLELTAAVQSGRVASVDYAGFVALTAAHQPVVSWY